MNQQQPPEVYEPPAVEEINDGACPISTSSMISTPV